MERRKEVIRKVYLVIKTKLPSWLMKPSRSMGLWNGRKSLWRIYSLPMERAWSRRSCPPINCLFFAVWLVGTYGRWVLHGNCGQLKMQSCRVARWCFTRRWGWRSQTFGPQFY
ncbi:Uncharacterized protein HZ326_25003 [Fusarium oxysporum f. sp. albedinis]|nr:Uncharacterized protein HZ326_25003 [Fusarium oxysporum f. sp. albedinis]